jgi:ribokinase
MSRDGRPTLAVVGAINVDLVVSGAPLPGPGETVVGGIFARHFGGKGGNQAVAAARALGLRPGSGEGPRVVMIAAVGDDDLGRASAADLAAEGIDLFTAGTSTERPTGVALIVVDRDGENQIAVAPGVNAALDGALVRGGLDACAPRVVLASLEVSPDAVRAAGQWCRDHGVAFILNPAPAIPEARHLAALASYVTPNEGERTDLGDVPDHVVVVETRGDRGARVFAGGATLEVEAPPVDVVDTTGAGDCFNGVFAAALLQEVALEEAVRRAVTAAALSVTRAGARGCRPP